MELVDDSNSYWWACRLISTGEVGYIPAENIETPAERLARLNRSRNTEKINLPSKPTKAGGNGGKRIKFADSITIIQADGVVRDEAVVQKVAFLIIRNPRKRVKEYRYSNKYSNQSKRTTSILVPHYPRYPLAQIVTLQTMHPRMII